jgi:preprotein translocase subunit YajC
VAQVELAILAVLAVTTLYFQLLPQQAAVQVRRNLMQEVMVDQAVVQVGAIHLYLAELQMKVLQVDLEQVQPMHLVQVVAQAWQVSITEQVETVLQLLLLDLP